jgi:hypothetical protein
MENENTGNIEQGEMSKAAFGRMVTTLGEREGMGTNSRPGLFVHFVEGAAKGYIAEDDVETYYGRYCKAVAAKQNIGYQPQSSIKQQVSKFKAAVKLGGLIHVNGQEVINVAIDVQKEQRGANEGKLPMSPLDGLVNVARAQLSFPDTPLTREQIDRVMRPTEKDDPTEADRLDKVASAMEKIRTDDDATEDTKTVLDAVITPILDRIKALGGTTAQREAASREQAKLAKQRAGLAKLMGVPDVTVTPVPDRLAAFLAARRAELASQVVEMTAADL